MSGVRMSLPFALIGVIVGEFLASSSGLGYRLNMYSTSYNTNGTFAMLLVMMVLMLALNGILKQGLSLPHNRPLPRHGRTRLNAQGVDADSHREHKYSREPRIALIANTAMDTST